MLKQSIISGVLAGIFYTLFMWLGDMYIFKETTPLHIYLIQGGLFTIIMTLVYYFTYKKRARKQ